MEQKKIDILRKACLRFIVSKLFLDGRNNYGQLFGIDSLNLINIGLRNYLLGFRDKGECTIFCVNSKKSIKKEATSCIIKLPTKINKGVTSKWILTQN